MPQDGVSNEGSRMGADVEMGTGNGSTMLPDLFEHDEEQEKMESIKDQLAALQVLPPPMAEWPSTGHGAVRPVYRVAHAERSKAQVGSACAFCLLPATAEGHMCMHWHQPLHVHGCIQAGTISETPPRSRRGTRPWIHLTLVNKQECGTCLCDYKQPGVGNATNQREC